MKPDRIACDRLWLEYLSHVPADHPHRAATPDAFAFGGGDIADELADLVLRGTKKATTSLPIEFTSLGEPLPEVGSVSIVLRASGAPFAIIERTEVKTIPFDEVDAAYAATEGEGDGSLAHWQRAHREYFESVRERLGGLFDERTPVICQVFRVVWPLRTGSTARGGHTAEP
jgi:uncharacterized protein YhfF